MTGTTAPIQEAKQQLHETVRQDTPFEHKAREVLELGCRCLDADQAYLTRINQATDRWETTITTETADQQTSLEVDRDLEETYCREAIDDDTPLALHDAPTQGWADDPASGISDFDAYLGVPLILDDGLYGTVCFVADEPRSEPFTDAETWFAEHLARLLERELERKQVETQLTKQTNLATVLNRVLRHNLRNDISIIRGYTQLMADQLDNETTSEMVLNHIDDLIDLTEKARELEEIVSASAERRQTNIGSLVEDVTESLADEHPTATISVEYGHDIRASVLQNFDRAVEELIENAIKHGGDQPTVTIGIEAVPDAVEIRIRDDGPGLPDQEAEVLREGEESPLFHGSGLGLWLAHWIVTSHDGSVEPVVTKNGTTMVISLPQTSNGKIQQRLGELERSRDKYQASVQQASDSILLFNDDGRITDANARAADLFGVDTQELLGRHIREFLPTEFDFETEWQSALQTSSKTDTVTIRTADGTERVVEYSVSADVIPGQHLFISRDITEKRQREQALRETKRRLDLALEAADTGVWDWNMETDEVTWDETMEQLFGLESGTFEGTLDAFIERVHPDDRDGLNSDIRTAIEEETQFESEYRIQRDDGRQHWVYARGKIFSNGEGDHMIGTVTDITERKQREREIESVKERYETLLDAAPDPVFVADAETEELIEVNEAATTLLGKSRDQLVGRNLTTLHPPIDAELYREAFKQNTGERTTIRTLPDGSYPGLMTADGETIPTEMSVDTVSLPERSVVFGICRDISERVDRERELEEYKTIVEALGDPIYVIDEDGRFTTVNDAFVELVGYDRETILGSKTSLIKPEHAVETAEQQLGNILSDDGPETAKFEVTIHPEDGEPIVCEDHMGVLPFEGEHFNGSVGTLREVTER